MNKQKNIDIAYEERFDYGLISINYGGFFFYTFVSYTSEHDIFFYSKIDICFQHIYFKTNINKISLRCMFDIQDIKFYYYFSET